MEDELTPEQKFAAEDPDTWVPRALMQGRSIDDIVAELVRLDWTPSAARLLIAQVQNDLRRFHESPESREHLVAEAKHQMMRGTSMAVAAAAITALTIIAAIGGVMIYIVLPFGLLCVGLVLAGTGMRRWRLYRRESLPNDFFKQDENGDS